MKTTLLVGCLLLPATVEILAQGSVNFSNAGGQPVVCLDGGRIPVGSTYRAELLFAPDGTPEPLFDQVAVRIGGAANFGPTPGFFSGGSRTIDAIQPAGGYGLFQVRIWETAYGGSYNEVIVSGQPGAGVGKSAIVRVDTANPLTGEPPASLGPSLGTIVVWDACIPEPSVSMLGAIAGGLMLMLYRRRS